MNYRVSDIRDAGVECKWGRTRFGAPAIFGKTKSGKWMMIDDGIWKRAKSVGIKSAFDDGTALSDIFSIRA